jgi:hypothetical protein
VREYTLLPGNPSNYINRRAERKKKSVGIRIPDDFPGHLEGDFFPLFADR